MAKIAQSSTKPSAWIVSPKDRGRKSIKNGKTFLNDGEEFEIELFNPLTVSVLADIKLNGQSISKTGLVLKPGQRFYLDCFIDDKKKFIFSTYQIDGSQESLDATQNNGLLEVFFYKEDIITLDNWKTKMDKIIVEKWYPVYYPTYYPSYRPLWYGTTSPIIGTTITTGGNLYGTNNTFTTSDTAMYSSSDNINCTYTSNTVNLSNVLNNSNLNTIPISAHMLSDMETGRVEKGSSSSQKFTEIDMDFENNYIASTIIQILPESRKPVETKDIKEQEINLQGKVKVNGVKLKDILKRESDDVIDLIKKLADLHSAGILTDEEFSTKKAELLSKI